MAIKKMGKLTYEVPEEIELDLVASVKGLKKKEGLAFHVIAQADQKRLPWMIIDKEAKASQRLAKALKICRLSDNDFKIGKVASGSVSMKGTDVTFTIDDCSIANINAKIEKQWPIALLKASNGSDPKIKLLAKLMKRAVIKGAGETEEEEGDNEEVAKEETLTSTETVELDKPLTKEELTSVFGDDSNEIGGASAHLATLLEHLTEVDDSPKKKKPAKVDPVKALVDAVKKITELDGQAFEDVVRTFIKSAQTPSKGDSQKSAQGATVKQQTLLASLAQQYSELLELESLLVGLQDQWTELNEEVKVLNKNVQALQPDTALADPSSDGAQQLKALDKEGKIVAARRDKLEIRMRSILDKKINPLQKSLGATIKAVTKQFESTSR